MTEEPIRLDPHLDDNTASEDREDRSALARHQSRSQDGVVVYTTQAEARRLLELPSQLPALKHQHQQPRPSD